MNAEQKRAWLDVATMVACVVGYLVLLLFFGPWVAFASFALYAVSGLGPLIGRQDRVDERDRTIARHAVLGAALASYLTFVLGCMGTWVVVFAFQGGKQVSVHCLPIITMLAGYVFCAVRGIAVLVGYGRHVEADDA